MQIRREDKQIILNLQMLKSHFDKKLFKILIKQPYLLKSFKVSPPLQQKLEYYAILARQNIKAMRITATLLLFFLMYPLFSQEFRTLCNEGIKNIAEHKYKDAVENFRKATEVSSNDNEKIYSYANLAYSQQMCGELEEAISNYNTAIALDKNETTLIQQRANIFMMLGNNDKALEDYNRVLEKEPNNTGALFGRANIYTNKGEVTKARSDYKQLSILEPENDNVKLGLAMLYRKEKKYNECLVMLELLIESNPGIAEYYVARSDVERELGQYELALMDINKAIELSPDNANYHTLQGILHEKSGNRKAAAESDRRAAELKRGKE